MTDKELNIVRQNIACPQFGDDHYGSWGALRLDQRRAIKRMVDTINRKNTELDRLTIYFDKAVEERLKQFAERLKAKFDQHGVEYTAYTIVDDVMKEMGVSND